jgi:hypothetical protein
LRSSSPKTRMHVGRKCKYCLLKSVQPLKDSLAVERCGTWMLPCVGGTASTFFLIPHALWCHFPALLGSSLPLFPVPACTRGVFAYWLGRILNYSSVGTLARTRGTGLARASWCTCVCVRKVLAIAQLLGVHLCVRKVLAIAELFGVHICVYVKFWQLHSFLVYICVYVKFWQLQSVLVYIYVCT